jgi:hypothetical protein
VDLVGVAVVFARHSAATEAAQPPNEFAWSCSADGEGGFTGSVAARSGATQVPGERTV